MTHPGHLKWLAGAIASVAAQDLDHRLLELQIVHDGPVDEAFDKVVIGATSELDFPTTVIATPEVYDYYTVPRNQALPHLRGYYVAHLDADNEWLPTHLSGLLQAMRLPDGDRGLPHFAYARRHYLARPGCTRTDVPIDVDSPLVPWDEVARKRLVSGPMSNFIDTSDFMTSKSALYMLADRTGMVWNPECRRFGDWDLVARMTSCGFRGRAVDQITHHYWWTGENVQLTRNAGGDNTNVIAIPEEIYERYRREGKIRSAEASQAAEGC